MTALTLTKTSLIGGVWQGQLSGDGTEGDSAPDLAVTHLGDPVPDVAVTRDDETGGWFVRVPIPVERIADGVQTFVITDAASDQVLASFTLVAGEPMAEDIRAEMDLLRAELDMLKQAFRRHCLETM